MRDFEHRFGRPPEGMWLPETAVDTPTLEALAEQGIAFTILAPHQAASPSRASATGVTSTSRRWTRRAHIASACPRAAASPSSSTTARSRAPSPSRASCATARSWPTVWSSLVRRSTTARRAGPHRHRRRDLRPPSPLRRMALAYALHYIEDARPGHADQLRRVPGAHPPTDEAEIVEDTSWSCAHGVERWRSDCGCNAGEHPDYTRSGARPCETPSTGSARTLPGASRPPPPATSRTPGPRRDAYIDVVHNPIGHQRLVAVAAQRSLSNAELSRLTACSSRSGRRSSCSPAAPGSSKTSPASRRCRSLRHAARAIELVAASLRPRRHRAALHRAPRPGAWQRPEQKEPVRMCTDVTLERHAMRHLETKLRCGSALSAPFSSQKSHVGARQEAFRLSRPTSRKYAPAPQSPRPAPRSR